MYCVAHVQIMRYKKCLCRRLRPNSITLSSSLAGCRPASEPALDLARELVRELVCDLLWLNSITLSRSQTWFPTCHRQVRAISTRRDSSNLVADRFKPYSITLSCSLAGRRPVRDQIPLRCPACDQLASWSQTCSWAGRKLDSVMELGLRHAHDVHKQLFVQLASSSRTSSRTSWRAGQRNGIWLLVVK